MQITRLLLVIALAACSSKPTGPDQRTAVPTALFVGGNFVPTTRLLLLIVLAACSGKPTGTAQRTTAPLGEGDIITIGLSNFAFDPEQIRLKTGMPIRLRLANESDGGHNFSAPTFFAASSFLPGSSNPSNGPVEVGPHQMVEIALVPGAPAAYPLECTYFLHSAFGMHGTVEVLP